MRKRGRKPKAAVKPRSQIDRLKYLRQTNALGKSIEELKDLIAEVQRISSSPPDDFAEMITEDHKRIIEDVVYPAVTRGVNLIGITRAREPVEFGASEDTVTDLYGVIERHLISRRTWTDTLHKFPPEAIRHAIRRAWFYLLGDCDWGTEFEHLKEHENIEDFIDDVINRSNLKRDWDKDAYQKALSHLERQAEELGFVIVDRREAEMLQALKVQRFKTQSSVIA
ncbi:MAG: hypothetical protein NWE93_11360 [Candidatus Bathyarchaeota archaeon]|nr:hypothetical protein [Candidatus Bathyarchaeota archaeon]